MEEEVDVSFPRLSKRDYALLIGAVYRQALIEVGYSPDYHVYNLNRPFLLRHKDSVSARFLLNVIAFYWSLPDTERRIFLCEYLENGRHYAYWWLEYMSFQSYSRKTKSMLKKVEKAF